MNGKRAKEVRRIGRQILVEWLRSIIPDEEDSKQINVNNLEEYLSEQTHVYLNRKFMLSAYSLKWIYKRVKRNPELTFERLKQDLDNEQKANTSGYDFYG
tara:strand:- start:1432 stop:1731 length:300 start_codon:yes stop_codon:yes gene_type:complete